MELKAEIDLGEFIRQGARVTLQPLVHFVNRRLREKFEDNWIEVASYIYANSDSTNRSLKVRDNKIHWDLYNITSFITHNQKKQKINFKEEVIDFRTFLFDDIREDIFIQLQALRAIRNITSHPVYDGEKEIGYLEAHDTETYLNIMQFIVQHFSNQNIYKVKLDNIIRAFNNNVKFLKDKVLRDQIETIQRNIYESERLKINKINFSSINLLKDVNKIKKDIYIKKFNTKYSQDQILLTFEDSSEQRYLGSKGNSFGPKALDIIYEKAKQYINKHIITTSWGEWNPQQYFNDIYLLSLDENNNFIGKVDLNNEKKIFADLLINKKKDFAFIKDQISKIAKDDTEESLEILKKYKNLIKN